MKALVLFLLSFAQGVDIDYPLGMNFGPVAYHSKAWAFVDVFKMGKQWALQEDGTNSTTPPNLTPDGWIASLEENQDAVTYFFMGIDGEYPGGEYHIFYDGEGDFSLGGDTEVISEAPGHTVVNVIPGTGIPFRLRDTNENNPLRNIRFIMPGFEDTYEQEPFHPLYLEKLEPFGVYRFMEWGKTNNSDVIEWTDRRQYDYAIQTEPPGVAFEWMIRLANRTRTDPWICVPHQANDEFIHNLAVLIRDTLDPTLKCYIEWSNEVWNWGFDQMHWATEQGIILWPDEAEYIARARFYGKRSVEVFEIFEEVFGGLDRLYRVLAWQQGQNVHGSIMLGWEGTYRKADIFAVNAYFGNGSQNEIPEKEMIQWSVDDVLDWAEAKMLEQHSGGLKVSLEMITRAGLYPAVYEGGPALTGFAWNPDIVEKYNIATRHPRMRRIYFQQMKKWYEAGGELFMPFNYAHDWKDYGRWGHLETQTQDPQSASKYGALLDYIQYRDNH
jgi:hypothetical protein